MIICSVAEKFNRVNKIEIEECVVNIYHRWDVKVRSYTTH